MTPLEVTADSSGERMDLFLSRRVPGLTRSTAQRLIEDGSVLLSDRPVKKNRRTKPGEQYVIFLPEPTAMCAVPQNIPLEVRFEDKAVIVVNKPVGMVVHPAPGHPDGTLVNALLHHCGSSLSGINGTLRPGIVHRLDRDTSGLIIAAKNDAAHLALAAQLEDHSLYREYHAVVTGCIREDRGTVDAPVGRHPVDRKKMAVDRQRGRQAVTHWEVLRRYPGHTYIKCVLETGRTHQIRVHLAYLGHPLLGDTVYGAKKAVPGLAGQCLHAKKLSFIHPVTRQRITVECDLPPWFRDTLRKLEQTAK